LNKFVGTTGIGKVLQQGAAYLSKLAQKPTPTVPVATLNPRATGAILMVVLLSFGLLFNGQLGLNGQRTLPAPPSLGAAVSSRVIEHPSYVPTSETRKLQELYESAEMPTVRIMQRVAQGAKMPSASSHSLRPDEAALKTTKPLVDPLLPHMADGDWKPNTTYLLCPEVQRLQPPNSLKETLVHPEAPLQLAFLIPPDALGTNAPSGSNAAHREFLEVTCQVTAVSKRPAAAKHAPDIKS